MVTPDSGAEWSPAPPLPQEAAASGWGAQPPTPTPTSELPRAGGASLHRCRTCIAARQGSSRSREEDLAAGGEGSTKDGVEQPEEPERAEEKLLPRSCETVELSINHFAHLADLHFALSYTFSRKLKSTVYSILFSSFVIL